MDNVKKIYITELILNISELVTEINLAEKHHAFLNHYGHTQEVEVRIYLGGWEKGKECDYSLNAYYTNADYETSLVNIIKILEEVKKN